ncbi:MAG: DUF2892 domain-containing protein [Ferruginibacter sp.]|nr:DUF2892 domain-containing protein [Ferruginibacter sp.]
MKKNIGSTDKIIRLVIAAVIAVLYFMDKISGTTAVILGAVAIIMLVTSFLNFCPIWSVLGKSTCEVKK